MSRYVKIAAVQLPNFRNDGAGKYSRDKNIQEAENWLTDAGKLEADIACLGEMFTTEGCQLSTDRFLAQIEPSPDALVERLGSIARQYHMYVIAPALTLVEGVPRNTAFVIDREGQLVGSYYKVHCMESERDLGIVPGNNWPVFQLDFGAIGIQLCHDNSFPESARCLSLNGAEIIFWPHVMSGWGDEFMDILMSAPAIYNGVTHVPVSYGCPTSKAWMPGMIIGRSSVIRSDGISAADAGRYPGIALGIVDLDAPRLAGSFTREGDYEFQTDMLNDRRQDTYAPLLHKREKFQPLPTGKS